MKRMLLVLAAAVFFLNGVAIPNVVRADTPGGPPPCQPGQSPPSCCPPGTLCKP
jgi:hypothetical protein